MAAGFWPREMDRLHAVFEATSDGVALFDLDGRLLLANLAFRKFFGLVPEGLSRDDPARTLDFLKSRARDAAEFERRFRTLLLHRETMEHDTVELALPHPRTLHRVRTPARDEAGRIVGHVHTVRDVTREREVAELKSEFVSRVSHELRTPLTSIKGSLQLLMDSARHLSPPDQELLSVCLRNTDRLIHLVNDVLDLSKIEAGKFKLKLADQAIPELVRRATAAVSGFAAERMITIDARLPPDLPSVRADGDRIVQVLTDLLSNAIKFSHPGGSVGVTARPVPGTKAAVRNGPDTTPPRAPIREFIEISVSDDGRGIAADDLGRIFGSFQQIDDAATREAPGTGLGLAICKGIVEKHGGKIWASSKGVGHGVTLTFVLPAPGPPSRRILVADDDAKFVRLVMAILETAEFTITSARDGRETLDKIRQGMPDLLILDLVLPNMDGWEVLTALRRAASTRDLPILVLTALGAEDAERTFALGASEYLSKPVSPTVLIETVHRLIAAAERSRQEAGTGVAAERNEGSGRPSSRSGDDRQRRIMVVEDDPASLELMVELLSPQGFDIRTCTDGQEVMSLARAHRPDLILLDINLPNVDGLTVARALREHPDTRSIAILAVSAYGIAGDEERILGAGCDGFIPKPIEIGAFFTTVSRFLDRGDSLATARGEETRPPSAS
jgi:PAS domain S-box-containing protein